MNHEALMFAATTHHNYFNSFDLQDLKLLISSSTIILLKE